MGLPVQCGAVQWQHADEEKTRQTQHEIEAQEWCRQNYPQKGAI